MKKVLLAVLVLIGLQTQAQISYCDSLSYSIIPNTILTVTPSSGGIGNIVGAINWNFTACNSTACYVPQGNNPFSFPLINMTDTVKLCYDAFIYTLDSTTIMCNYCDSLVYDFNSFAWVVMLRNIPTGLPGFVIEEDGVRWWNNIIYDLQGRELNEIPVGKMYIRNGKLNINK